MIAKSKHFLFKFFIVSHLISNKEMDDQIINSTIKKLEIFLQILFNHHLEKKTKNVNKTKMNYIIHLVNRFLIYE